MNISHTVAPAENTNKKCSGAERCQMIRFRSSYSALMCSLENAGERVLSIPGLVSYQEVRVVLEAPESQPLESPFLPSLLADLKTNKEMHI